MRVLNSADCRFGSLVAAVTTLALFLRIMTLDRSWTQIDEPASLLAIEMVATKGIPLFPSDVLYLQGAFFSYLAAPLAWFFDGNALMNGVQWLYLVLALTLVPITMIYARFISSSQLAATMVGVFVACDPNLIAWSVAIRPYGMLAAETVLTLYCFTRLMTEGKDSRVAGVRTVYWIPVLATIGTFIHAGFWLVAPGLAVVAITFWKSSLLTSNRIILICSSLAILAPTVFVGLGSFIGVGNGTSGANSSDAFMGSHLFSLDRLIEAPTIRWVTWTSNFSAGSFHQSLPYMVVLASGVLILHAMSDQKFSGNRAAATLLISHWSMVLIVVVLVVFDPQPRYLVHTLPLAYVVIGWATAIVWQTARQHDFGTRSAVRVALALLIIVPALSNSATAAEWRMNRPGYDADYWQITSWVGDRYEAGQVVITSLPPAAAFWFPESVVQNQMYFLAGPEGRPRSRRYIKTQEDGATTDYWMGIPSITSVDSLCAVLKHGAGLTWIITDGARLGASWAYKGDMADLILGTTDMLHEGPDNSQARFVRPVKEWDPGLSSDCIHTNNLEPNDIFH